MPEISIIVPVYNGAQYIKQCVSFLDAQRFDDFEIIFSVDTKSSDNTMEIVETEQQTNPRIRVVKYTDDGQQAGARNTGFAAAQGNYVWFCDVDDAPSPDFLPIMHDLAARNNADFSVCAFVNVGPEGIVKSKYSGTVRVFDHEAAVSFLSRGGLPIAAWSKLFRRSFLMDNGILFHRSFAEDIDFTYRVVYASDRIVVTDMILYAYRLTPGSYTRSPGNRKLRALSEIESYRAADEICTGHPDMDSALRHNAIMRMRSSSHMELKDFLEYRHSPEAIEDNRKYFKGTLEGGLYYHFPRLYHFQINAYIRLIYKRNGSRGMKKLR